MIGSPGMRAAVVASGRVEVRSCPDPTPGPGEILVAVRASGINNADLGQRAGYYPAPPDSPADIPGLELAGEVIGLGRGATRFAIGDRVMALVGGGGQAELATLPERLAMPVPEGVPWEEAGGFPEAFVTAHDALFSQCSMVLGERVLIHAGAGGVGVAAAQLAAKAGGDVTATVRDERCRALVADLGVRSIGPDTFTEHGPYDVIIELVGAATMPDNLRALSTGGRISVIARSSGARAEIDFARLMALRAQIHGASLRSRPLESKARAVRLVEHQVLPLLADGRVRVPVYRSFRIDDVEGAYALYAAPGKFGKIVLQFP
jgi:NADPH:quinone reductase